MKQHMETMNLKWISDKQRKGEKLNFHERNILRIAEKRDRKKQIKK